MTAPLFTFDRESSRAVDRAAIEEYAIPGIVLMENAARALAFNALEMLSAIGNGQSAIDSGQNAPLPIADCPLPNDVLIVCGAGNNGGDGYAAARHLHNAGCDVTLCSLGEPRVGGDAAINRAICRRMTLREVGAAQLTAGHGGPAPPLARLALIVDALFGTGLDRPVEGDAARVIQWINEMRGLGSLILAADIPSGLDCDTGRELGIAVRAHRTVSFLGRKKGFLQPGAKEFTGTVVVGDIGAPVELVKRLSSELAPTGRPGAS